MIGDYVYRDWRARQNKEFLNESVLMCLVYCMICFSPFVPDIPARQVMGYVCCSLLSIHLAIYFGFIVYSTALNIKIEVKNRFALFKLKWQRQKNAVKLKNRKHSLKEFVLNY